MYIDVDSIGSGVEFDDAIENPRLQVGLASDGGIVHTVTTSGKVGTALKIYDASADQRAYVGIFTHGDSGFQAFDASGNATWTSP